MSFQCTFLNPQLTTYHSHIGVQIIVNVGYRNFHVMWTEPTKTVRNPYTNVIHLREISLSLYLVQVRNQYLHIIESYKNNFLVWWDFGMHLFCSTGFGCILNLVYSEAIPEVLFEHLRNNWIQIYSFPPIAKWWDSSKTSRRYLFSSLDFQTPKATAETIISLYGRVHRN